MYEINTCYLDYDLSVIFFLAMESVLPDIRYFGLNVCVPLKFIYWSLFPGTMAWEVGPLGGGEVMTLEL